MVAERSDSPIQPKLSLHKLHSSEKLPGQVADITQPHGRQRFEITRSRNWGQVETLNHSVITDTMEISGLSQNQAERLQHLCDFRRQIKDRLPTKRECCQAVFGNTRPGDMAKFNGFMANIKRILPPEFPFLSELGMAHSGRTSQKLDPEASKTIIKSSDMPRERQRIASQFSDKLLNQLLAFVSQGLPVKSLRKLDHNLFYDLGFSHEQYLMCTESIGLAQLRIEIAQRVSNRLSDVYRLIGQEELSEIDEQRSRRLARVLDRANIDIFELNDLLQDYLTR